MKNMLFNALMSFDPILLTFPFDGLPMRGVKAPFVRHTRQKTAWEVDRNRKFYLYVLKTILYSLPELG